MTTFEDNTVVTAEDLNGIAVDLGDTTFSAFSNKKFGVDKLNEITADLVSKGVLATDEKCEPILSNGKLYIKRGTIVFNSGAKIKITEPIEVSANNGDYIYAYNDVLTGKASIIAGAEEPIAGDYVILAQLDGAGAIVDKRVLSTAKAISTADFSIQTFSNTVTYKPGYGTLNGEINLATTELRRLVGFNFPVSPQWTSGYILPDETNCYYDFTNTKSHFVFVRFLGTVPENYGVGFYFTLDGTKLKWSVSGVGGITGNSYNYTMTVNMI